MPPPPPHSPPPPSPPASPPGITNPPPPPPPPIVCETVPSLVAHATGCLYDCGGHRYDLSSMLEWSGGTMTALDQRGAQYHWALCGQILPVQHLQGPIGPCNASLSVNDVAAATRVAGPYDLGPDGPPGACETVGLWKDTLGYPVRETLPHTSSPP